MRLSSALAKKQDDSKSIDFDSQIGYVLLSTVSLKMPKYDALPPSST